METKAINKINWPVSILLLIIAFLTEGYQKANVDFESDISSGKTPWNYVPSQKPGNDFTFAVISDLNSGERPGVFEVAVEQLNMLRPDFILSIGDLIEGGSEDTLHLKKEFDFFDQRVSKAYAPFFHVGGNHDLTSSVMQTYWQKRYGRTYYYFVYHNVLFLQINTEDYSQKRMSEIYTARKRALELLDSGKKELAAQSDYFKMPERLTGEISNEQSEYFEKVIADHRDVEWTFLLMHKPVWKREGDGGLSRIEKALYKRKYTVINGHLHEYGYATKNNLDYITLATTGGGQNNKSKNAFDHILWVTFTHAEPSMANLKLEGILDKTGNIPRQGDTLCFQASKCMDSKK